MLSSPEEEVLAKACEAILRYAEKGLFISDGMNCCCQHPVQQWGNQTFTFAVLIESQGNFSAPVGDENKSSLVGLGVMEPLCHLLSHGDSLVSRNAVMAVGVMSSNSKYLTKCS